MYCAGKRTEDPATLQDTIASLREHRDALAWIGLYRPSEAELNSLAGEFGLHELAVEDAIVAHQRPKLERYGDTLFVVLRAARYLDDVEEVEFGELHVFLGADFVITVRHAESPDLGAVRHRLEEDPELLARGTEAVLYAILDAVVDGYFPVADGLETDIDEIETQVFGGDPAVSRRIYELSREVLDFQRATLPLTGMLEALAHGFEKYDVDGEQRRALRDVADHVTQVNERVEQFRVQLRDILTVNSILVGQRQNEEMTALSRASNAQNDEVKKISAWAAIGFAPTTIASIYGMNFDHMPELHVVPRVSVRPAADGAGRRGALPRCSSGVAGSDALPLTGERTVPGIARENYWFRRHEAAYMWPAVRGARVLEVGCGEGYGTALLARDATSVLGVDYDALTIAHAARTYPQASFARANLAALPVRSATIDVLATLQVIEHVWHHHEFLAQCHRVLRPGGTLLVTTPNRLTFSPGLDVPVNPFHTKEFTATELVALLRACGFVPTFVGGLHSGPRLGELDAAHGGSFVDAQLAAPPDEWPAQLRADVASVRTADFEVYADADRRADDSLDLVVLATPSGDAGPGAAGSAG